MRNRARHCAVVTALLLSLSGCSWLIKPPDDQPAARRRVEAAMAVNADLRQYKGLAQAQLLADGQSMQGRIALAAMAPDRLRVQWLSTLGQPLTSLAGDGETITVLMHADAKIYRLPQLRTALERVVQIPIGIEDLLSIMAGRPPLPAHTAAQMDTADTSEAMIVLKNRWQGIVATLEVDPATGRAQALKIFDGTGNMQYDVQWRRWKPQGGFAIPQEVVLRSPEAHRLTLIVDRFWPNAEVSPALFVLTLPKNQF